MSLGSKTSPSRLWNRLCILATVAVNVGCDQYSKVLVRQNVEFNDHIGLIGPYLTLTHVQNTGAFLSLGNALPDFFRLLLLTVLPIIVLIIGLVYLLMKTKLSSNLLLGASLLVGGGIGNLYDRLVYGSVTEFLHLKIAFFQTGIFNVADMSIMAGVGLMLIDSFQSHRKQRPHSSW